MKHEKEEKKHEEKPEAAQKEKHHNKEDAHKKDGGKEKAAAGGIKEKDEKIKELNDKYLRALAELENFRKRVSKDKEDFVKYTRGDTARLMIPVLDNLDRAVHATKITDNIESLRHGVELVIKQFEDVLKELGVREVEASGIFDPDKHQVVFKEHRDGAADGEIIEVYQKGYMCEDRVIRPAMVKVSVAEEKKEEAGAEAEEGAEAGNNAENGKSEEKNDE